ncbi:hypothetical protein Baya_6165 [Bagarius yarrelli]|uniref:Uncharacterized protein n=1 Tax=Bagarius yarrelli TaxID=175774 RepID=A0A556U565_BAGYA|nr:hypothetical protein Baya_6165 [Bagarius yarrelli]
MLKTLTKKLRRHSLNEIHPFQLKVHDCHHSKSALSAEIQFTDTYTRRDLVQSAFRCRKPYTTPLLTSQRCRNCVLTPLATSQQPNQGLLSPCRVRRVRLLLEPAMERHSSEEELERIAGIASAAGAETGCRWYRHGELSSTSSDEEVKDLCEPGASPSPVLFSSSPPRGFKPTHTSTRLHSRPIILSHFEQPSVPYWRHRREPGRPSLDLEKMQQKMLLKKNCGGKTRKIKIRNLTGSRHPPRYSYDPSIFAFRSLSNAPSCSPLLSSEEPPCA